MNKFTFILFALLLNSYVGISKDKEAYNIKIKINNISNTECYMGYHFAEKQYVSDTAHFWIQDQDGNNIDPTSSQYHDGELIDGKEISVNKNYDEIINHDLFSSLDESQKNKILSLNKKNL